MVSFHAPNEAHSTSAPGPGGGSADGLRTRDSARLGGVLAREFPGSGWPGGASSVLGAEPGDVAGEAAGGPRRQGSILSPLQFHITSGGISPTNPASAQDKQKSTDPVCGGGEASTEPAACAQPLLLTFRERVAE